MSKNEIIIIVIIAAIVIAAVVIRNLGPKYEAQSTEEPKRSISIDRTTGKAKVIVGGMEFEVESSGK